MGKINILEPNVFNMLAAGEVVERPASVVKELVENAIDAGATQIDVTIENGGISKIQVSDNGIGIQRADMRAAFLPHATSKLKDITDLDALSTLGFRGEALASIASVSEVTLTTKSNVENIASKIVLSAGKVTFEGDASRQEGTCIRIENLFFNTPARLKFLKKPQSEQRHVHDVVKAQILANPQIAISLSAEDGTLLSHEGGELIDAIFSVYDAKTADSLLEITPYTRGDITIKGFTSKVDFVKANRTYQTIIVNGRAVEDSTIVTAVEKAYSDYLMKRAYPMFVLDIVLPFDDVDSNVHPSKIEVRFRDKQAVFSAVFHAIKDTVENSISKTRLGFDVQQSSHEDQYQSVFSHDFAPKAYTSEPTYTQTRIDTSSLYHGKTAPKNYNSYEDNMGVLLDKSGTYFDAPKINPCDYGGDNFDNSIYERAQEDTKFFDGNIIGQIFSTYIIVERDEKVYIIDQHAAHERILYDKIIEKFSVEFSQPLLIPYKIVPTSEEAEYIDSIYDKLQSFGFEIQKNAQAYLITAVPEPISKISFGSFFRTLFSNLQSQGDLSMTEILKDKICQQACKAAIKGGEALSREQIERVLTTCLDKDGNLPSQCPHGRPAVISLSKTDIEKMFKRIV